MQRSFGKKSFFLCKCCEKGDFEKLPGWKLSEIYAFTRGVKGACLYLLSDVRLWAMLLFVDFWWPNTSIQEGLHHHLFWRTTDIARCRFVTFLRGYCFFKTIIEKSLLKKYMWTALVSLFMTNVEKEIYRSIDQTHQFRLH